MASQTADKTMTISTLESLKAKIDLMRDQLTVRLGGLVVAVYTLLFAALHYWPPHP